MNSVLLKCEICGKADGKIYGKQNKFNKPLCERHYAQYRRLGTHIDESQRSIRDKNEIFVKGEHAEVVLYKNNKEVTRTLIDADDIGKVKKFKWHYMDNGYVVSKQKGESILLHRLIMNCPPDKTVDHINHDTFDNRKENLRICTMQENTFNRRTPSNNRTGHTGVRFNDDRGKWEARLMINGKNLFLGRYDNIEQAILARKNAEKKHFGEYKLIRR